MTQLALDWPHHDVELFQSVQSHSPSVPQLKPHVHITPASGARTGCTVFSPAASAALSSAVKIGVPQPVAGSQPLVQLNPYGTGPVPRPIALVPLVTCHGKWQSNTRGE